MARIGLITTDQAFLRGIDVDTGPLAEALRRAGHVAEPLVWHDPAVAWDDYDLLIIRTPWDYPERYAEFMAWLDRASRVARVLNDPALIRWNIDKRYLDDFRDAGIPIVPTDFCDTGADAAAAISRLGGRLVVKPSVSAGSRDTGLFEPGDPGALALARRILDAGKTVMVQPAVEEVITAGELALFFFDGEYAASFHKGPILAPGGQYVGGSYRSTITRGAPSDAEIAFGREVIAAVAGIAERRSFGAEAQVPLYARVDIVPGAAPQVIEVEVFEPAYRTDVLPEAETAFVRAVEARLGR